MSGVAALTAHADPVALVPGDLSNVGELSDGLRGLAENSAGAATTLRAVQAGSWVGPASDAFREQIGSMPSRLEDAADAFDAASRAYDAYGAELVDARTQAARAVELMAEADRLTAQWAPAKAAQDQQVQMALGLRPDTRVGPALGPPQMPALTVPDQDPGEPLRAHARRVLDDARDAVAEQGRACARRLREAQDKAPDEPGFWSKALHQGWEFVKGAGEATYGLAEFAWKMTPTYFLIDPEGYVDNQVGLAKGLLYGVQHPKEFGKAVLDWDTWAANPARALGHLVPDLILAVSTGGAGTAVKGVRALRAVRTIDDLAEAGTGLRRLSTATHAQREAWTVQFGKGPSDFARGFQKGYPYDGTDNWRDAVASAKTRFAIGTPGEGRFAVPSELARGYGGDSRAYNEAVQVGARTARDGTGRLLYRTHLQHYEVVNDMPVGVSLARANPQFGPGGAAQFVLPDKPDLLELQGYLRKIDLDPLTNIESTIPKTGIPGVTPHRPSSTAPNIRLGVGVGVGSHAAESLDRLQEHNP